MNSLNLCFPGQVLNHFMEDARRSKQASREKQANKIKMGIPSISDNVKLVFSPISERDWSREVEKYCGRVLSKSLVRHLCHDTEIVPSDLVPNASLKVFKSLSRRFPEVLAIKVNSIKEFDMLKDHEDANRKLVKLCPVTFQVDQ